MGKRGRPGRAAARSTLVPEEHSHDISAYPHNDSRGSGGGCSGRDAGTCFGSILERSAIQGAADSRRAGGPPGNLRLSLCLYLPLALPAALARKTSNEKNSAAEDPLNKCYMPGVPRINLLSHPFQIFQTPTQISIAYEYIHNFRNVYLKRDKHLDGIDFWQGDSLGHWDGDTLVVESIGFPDGQWLDARGSQMTESARITERFRRPNLGNMQIEVTVNDPKAYTRPWTVTIHQTAVLDTEMIDLICTDNEKDVQHLTVE